MTAPLLSGGGEACRRAEQAFFSCIQENGMEELLARGVLLAFSGGMDSVLLFALMKAYTAPRGIPFAAAHVHHGIRGEGADRDADFCEQMAKVHGVPFFLVKVDAPAYARAEGRGRGEEAAARELRYAALERLLDENPSYGVAVSAHHATDNLETVLLNLVRGSGVRGMCGIPPVRGRFLRPLLTLPKRDVEAAIAELGLSYVTDETNLKETYDRNYIRANILPHLYHLRGDPEGAATRLSANLREEAAVLDMLAKRFLAEEVKNNKIPRAALLSLPQAVAFRVICAVFASCGASVHPTRQHIGDLLAVLASACQSGHYPMPGGFRAEFTPQFVTFCLQKQAFCAPYDILLQMGENKLGESGGTLWLFPERNKAFEAEGINVYNLFIQAKLDSATIGDVLQARTRREGDAYRYGGMTRRVRRLMAGRHLSPALRATLPVLLDSRGILWVPGFGVRDKEEGQASNTLYAYYTYGKKGEAPMQ